MTYTPSLTRTGQTVTRVRDTITGHQVTIPIAAAESDPGRYRASDSPAVDGDGRPLPPKHQAQLGITPEYITEHTTEEQS